MFVPMLTRSRPFFALSFLLLAACGSEDEPRPGVVGDACTPGEAPGCDVGLSCDPWAAGDGSVCAQPIAIRGEISDALSGESLAAARVVVLAADGSPVGDVAYSDDTGRYSILVSAPRNSDGSVAETATWTLSASAQGYEPFPAGPRPALPISAIQSDDELVIDASNTGLALLPHAEPERYARRIQGTIAGPSPGGTLVVAEGAPAPAPHAIASHSGEFTIFNVPSGRFELAGYKRGQQLERAAVTTLAGSVSDARLELAEAPSGAVSGNVNIVNAPGDSATSVVLVPQSVFDARLERGPIPLGLRAPGLPQAPSVSGAFAIDQVPEGDYVVLAAFENDRLVRDPDTSIAGTALQAVRVGAGESVIMSQSFKITEHLAIVAPGATIPERVSGDLRFVWVDDSSEDRYELELFTALGDLVWEQRSVVAGTGGGSVEVAYTGPELTSGMLYQFRVTSFRDRNGDATAISRSEDLRGVFEYRAP